MIENQTNVRWSEKVMMPADWSFIKLGTKGEWNKKVFEVIGRVRLQLINSYKNVWYVAFDDRTCGWLFEFNGNMSISPSESIALGFDQIKKLRPGKNITLSTRNCEIVSIEEVERLICEGEVGNWQFFRPNFFLTDGVLYNQVSVFFRMDIPNKLINYFIADRVTLENFKKETFNSWNEWQ
ncbi:MAG: hypothetical protein ACOVMQ_00860 [Cyclobacteriaceae bacterium]